MATADSSGTAPARAPITKQELLTGFIATVCAAVREAMEAGDTALADGIVKFADHLIAREGLLS